MIFAAPPPAPGPLRAAVRAALRQDETACVEERLTQAAVPAEQAARIQAGARALVEGVRRRGARAGSIDAFMHEYDLSSQEGVVLMCLAEALLRIPDGATADRLISDKIGGADWERHLGRSESVLVNASTWALMLTGRLVRDDSPALKEDWRATLTRLVRRSGEPVIRQAVVQAMRIMGRQFVMGRTIGEALERARETEKKGYTYSYDMLGEAARTMEDAERYCRSYAAAITAIGAASAGRGPLRGPGISVKLSALHPRYEVAQRDRVLDELTPRLIALCRQAREVDIPVCIDAEEADRLDLSLDVIEAASDALRGWNGLGLAVQAYQKRAWPLIDWLADMARRHDRRLMVRLVKGAYWDAEVKHAQVQGMADYPVFTRKASTDVSYLACARKLLSLPDAFHCAFATHNAHTAAAIMEIAGPGADFEFQRLHGMGEALYDQIIGRHPCRIYAPVGSHEDLLAYLVRRLLENGANTSFVNRIVDERLPVDALVSDPVAEVRALDSTPHPRIRPPRALFADRVNSRGVDLADPATLEPLRQAMEGAVREWTAAPMTTSKGPAGAPLPVTNPANTTEVVGTVREATAEGAAAAVEAARRAQPAWDATPAERRAAILERAADLFEVQMPALMAMAVREAGKTLPDAVAEVREAVDFLRYYAVRCRAEFSAPTELPGPTGERNTYALHGRGVFVCISPWNFPLAIFTGQVAAALAAGNAVCAKPAEQTPLIAARAVALLHEAGVPPDVLHLLPGRGEVVGAALVAHPGIAGVAFTGGTDTARRINRTLAERDGPIIPLIAETGGQNALIVDSSALPEQVARDVLASAFQSAGQRCSALRVLFLQEDVADTMLRMIAGAMAELRIGDPALLTTDVGPVIDAEARDGLEAHAVRMAQEGRLIEQTPLTDSLPPGHWFAPRAFEIDRLDRLTHEVFGPVLHVIRWKAGDLEKVIAAINATGFGLTLGVHSRIDATVRAVAARGAVGNCYVNRNQIGAIVGCQPFGGEGLSGTGPKAGGPRYLARFATERVVSVDTTAAGGNAALMAEMD
ncbi:bifunctional proline dehydrogenase/L-glutamate gamma-semialdehyde dehydrogenase PutA [Novispirillum sp. DQ9]|uniref:bifunctional proline dehydrogenase/L-glutamate gamma-semialdehyde dehydrogenase PutA n=1 Tax=Novispirillum sp. DQ9 TaxID=3398612 RepID=UPI003C79B7AD